VFREELLYIIGETVQGPTVGQGQKRNEREKKQRDRCSRPSGGHTHILNVADFIYNNEFLTSRGPVC
jgi:hypothetical protein